MTTITTTKYETIIGLEVHAQLLTKSKMFCPCSADYSASPPNTHVCPVCLGMPGVLPVINRQAVELTIMTALALNCEIPGQAKFDRKNYSYPDLMKGYQISQYDMPLSRNGWLEIGVDGQQKRVGITRVHLEEDVAKLVHCRNEAGETYSLVDVNRSGVPLMEIVSEPDMRSPEEAVAYLTKLRQILRYIGASQANMEEGNMRCEPNVSIRPTGSTQLGAKVELKNINSFRAVYEAIKSEVERQISVVESGGCVTQETRGWREDLRQAVPQRSKEFAHDYRYFPEPDLPPLAISREWVEEVRARLPELPDAKRQRFLDQYGLSRYEVNLLTETRQRADFFEACLAGAGDEAKRRSRAKAVANWMLGDLARLLNISGHEIQDSPVRPQHLASLIDMIEGGSISTRTAKEVLEETFRTGRDPREIVKEKGLTQVSAADELGLIVESVIAANGKAVADYRSGKAEALKFLVGQVMKETRGRANPALANQLLEERLSQ